MDRQLIRELQTTPSRLDGVDVADHVGDRHIRRRQFLDKPLVSRKPRYRQVVALLRDPATTAPAEWCQRIVMDLTARHNRDLLVEEIDERSKQPSLRLAPKAEDDEVVTGQDRVDDLWDDRLVVADDAWEQLLPSPKFGDQVVAKLLFDVAMRDLTRSDGPSQLAQKQWLRHARSYMNSCALPWQREAARAVVCRRSPPSR